MVAVAVLVGVGLTTWVVATPSDPPAQFEVDLSSPAPAGVSPGAAAAALQTLENAIADGDVAAARAVASTQSGSAPALLESLVTNARDADIVDVSLRYVDEVDSADAGGGWSAAVAVEWRYAGFDDAPARTETVVRFAPDADAVRIVGIGGDTLRTPVWMTGALSIDRSPETLVLVTDPSSAERYDRLAQRAVRVVSRVLTDWDPSLVVEVPATETALERALDADPDYYQQIAAVTGSADGSIDADAPVHVYVNPEVFDGLGRSGQQVVLAHETAHVAGDGPTSRAPTWLVEGFADYVALRDSSLPLSTTAAQIRDQVRAEGPPTRLPGPAEFDTRGPHLGAVYESAWLACLVLAERGNDVTLRRFYDTVSAGASVDRQFHRMFGWSIEDFVLAWQQQLTSLSG